MSILLPWIYTIIAVTMTSLGHVLFKSYSNTKRKMLLIMTATVFVLIPVFSFLALQELSIAQVYLCTAAVPVLTTLGAKFILGEHTHKHHYIGLSFITIGTIIYVYFSL